MSVRLRIVNIKEFTGQLNKLGAAVEQKTLQGALSAGAKPIIKRWKELARYKTGTYRRSIHDEPLPSKGLHHAAVQIGTDITDPPYPVFLEFGTSRMPAYPAARPAWDEKIDEAMAEVKNTLKDTLEKAAR